MTVDIPLQAIAWLVGIGMAIGSVLATVYHVLRSNSYRRRKEIELASRIMLPEVAEVEPITHSRITAFREYLAFDIEMQDQAKEYSIGEGLVAFLKLSGIQVEIVGSCRRGVEYPNDLDLLVIAPERKRDEKLDAIFRPIMDTFEWQGDSAYKCTLFGIRIHIIITDLKHYGFDLLHFTGSRKFNELVKAAVINVGWEIKDGTIVADHGGTYSFNWVPQMLGRTELEILQYLKLSQYIDPTTRSL